MNSRKKSHITVMKIRSEELRRIFRHNACRGVLSAAAPVRGGCWLCLLGAGKARDGAGQEVRRGLARFDGSKVVGNGLGTCPFRGGVALLDSRTAGVKSRVASVVRAVG